MNRRNFIKQGAIWVPSLFAIGRARGQAFTFRDPAFVRKAVVESVKTSASDDFNRANSDPLSDPGGALTWSVGPGGFEPVKIVSNQVIPSGSGAYCGAVAASPTFAADQECTVTIGTEYPSWTGPVVRAQSGSANCYMLFVTGSLVGVELYKVTNGSSTPPTITQLGSTYTISALTNGDTLTLRSVGTTLTIYKNGVALSPTVTDSTYSSGQPGLFFLNTVRSITEWTATDI